MYLAWKIFLATREKMSKTPRIRIPPEVKKYVFERDKYQCQSCGKTTTETHLSIDHIIPLSRGGQNEYQQFTNSLSYLQSAENR